jgi:hypothetical protein
MDPRNKSGGDEKFWMDAPYDLGPGIRRDERI